MEYRTILVHADPSVHAPARIRLAALLAERFGAHLVGAAATGISRFVCPEGYSGGLGSMMAGYLDPVWAHAGRMLDQFETFARAAGASSLGRKLISDQAGDGLARQAAFADLLVLSQDDPAESTTDVVTSLPEYVILNCARPVLVVPHGHVFGAVGRGVLVGWNGSREASAAIEGAIPLMRGAESVSLAIFEPPVPAGTSGIDAQAGLAAWLGRHGIRAAVLVRPAAADVGAQLLALAGELRADLLVMGCYGHARLRELLLGGASRSVLRSMTVPVLMAH
jgi:nucleotide-binding universal stress UspA family protein